MLHCRGNLDKSLDDFEILDYSEYNGKNVTYHHMDDSLVPFISMEKLEEELSVSLRYCPEALRVPLQGQVPVWVGPTELAKEMELEIKNQTIKSDASVYG